MLFVERTCRCVPRHCTAVAAAAILRRTHIAIPYPKNSVKLEIMESDTLKRLQRVAGRRTLILTHYGRKSGKAYQVPIWFVLDGNRIFLGTANVNRQWVRNVQKTPQVTLTVAGETFEGEARFLIDRAEHERAQATMQKKYWMYWPAFAVVRILLAVGLAKDHAGAFEVTVGKKEER